MSVTLRMDSIRFNGDESLVNAIKGESGEDGHTPEKGVDYMTSEDIDAMVLAVKNSVQPTVAELTQSMDGVTALLGQVRDAILSGDPSAAANLIDRYLS